MNSFFKNKVALVTGAGSGMGLATAQAFAAEGAAVVLADINELTIRTAAERLVAAGGQAIAIRCDVTDESQVKSMVEQTVSAFGWLDAVFNNAGVQSLAAETADATSEEFDRVNAINLRSVWLCMKYELLQMRRQKRGAIVNNFFYRGTHRHPWPGHLSCNQTRCDWPHEERCSGICRQRYSHQCRVSRRHRNPHGCRHDR